MTTADGKEVRCPCCGSDGARDPFGVWGRMPNACPTCSCSWDERLRAPSAQAFDPRLWQVVPKEPTETMLSAGHAAMEKHHGAMIHEAIAPVGYRAMLAAAPPPPPPDAAAKDLHTLGISVMKGGERVDPRELYAPPDIAQVRKDAEQWFKQNELKLSYLSDPVEGYRMCWCAALGVKP